MLKTKHFAVLAGVVPMVLGGGPSPSLAQEKINIIFASAAAATISVGKSFKDVLKPALEKYSDGRIAVTLHLRTGLCSEMTCVDQIKIGAIQMGSLSTANIGAFGKTFDLINLPYLFKDPESAERILNSWLFAELRKQAAKEMGLYLVAIVPAGGFRALENTRRVVRVPADLKGIKIRVTKSPMEFTLIKAWGAIPVPYDWSALYQGLQTGVVEGSYVQDPWIESSKMYEVLPHMTLTGGNWGAHAAVADFKWYSNLPAWAKEAVDKAGLDTQKASFALNEEWIASARKVLRQKVKIYQPTKQELQLWTKASRDAWVGMKGAYDPALARRILEEQGQSELIQVLESAGAL